MTEKSTNNEKLVRTLKPIHLWALAVGLVISGNFFGWSYGYGTGGPLGLFLSCIPVVIFYATFIFCYSEMATMIPHAGGPSAYARRAMGPAAGYFAGISCLIEFLFAPPAIALAVGWYIHNLIPIIPAIPATIVVFVIFVFINFLGMHTSAVFELIVTIVALVGLCIFWAAAAPHFSMDSFLQPLAENNGFDGFLQYIPGGWTGIMASVPFAIWFYLALEGGAMAAEEMVNPQKDIPKGFLTGMLTLFIMMCFTLFLTAGIVDYNQVSAVDFPLPAALEAVYGKGALTIIVNFLGLFGLIASLNGIIVGSSRQLYAMARTGYLPKFIAGVNAKRHTPTAALIIAGVIGILAATTGLTSVVITLSVFGSVGLYFISLISFFVLRSKEPNLNRPFKVPGGILVAAISMAMCLFCLISLFVTTVSVPLPESSIAYMIFGAISINPLVATVTIYVVAYLWFFIGGRKNIRPFDEEFDVLSDLDAA
ncbi:ethanolamine permease [Sinanaerobacter chloroacetimidivorans]|uniref:Ethanolamine permease n=1 Tax=Sinanaerobacter chloroacetimidivorans TaxID=2818044 RepID=A0A8J8B306_9FIRM|nr:ethanolamine permease [Sinanaerobacter chloroacetimidivorans]MBR0599874.1 ethanolamine permease [Sinanaerobacter chloroacetimidivorans]